MIALWVLLTLLREVLRAVGTPVRLLLYLPRRRYWRAQAAAVLRDVAMAEGTPAGDDLGAFLARAPRARPDRPHVFVSAGEIGRAHV